MLRLEFEQTLAANEQTGPINREMRHLITSLQNHNQQLKNENSRFKKKLKESNHEIIKLKHQIDQVYKEEKNRSHQELLGDKQKESIKSDESGSSSNQGKDEECKVKEEFPIKIKEEKESVDDIKKEKIDVPKTTLQASQGHASFSQPTGHHMHHGHYKHHGPQHHVKKEGGDEPIAGSLQHDTEKSIQLEKHERRPDGDQLRELKNQLKRATEQNRELKILLDMFKSADKEKRYKILIINYIY